MPDAEALYKLLQERFGLAVDDPKHGFTLAELTAVMAGFDTHPQAGIASGQADRNRPPPGRLV